MVEPIDVACPCGASLRLDLVTSCNVGRHPELRAVLLDGRLNTVICAACDQRTVVECELLYTDLDHDVFIGVFPVGDRARVDEYVPIVEAAWIDGVGEHAPDAVLAWAGQVRRRVVFGYDQLVEKVLCFEHGVDDRVLEAWKTMVLALDPDYPRLGVTDLRLAGVEDGRLVLLATGSDGLPRFALRLDPAALLDLAKQPVASLFPGLFEGPFVHHTGARPASDQDPLV